MTTKINPTDEAARSMIESFVQYIADLKAVYRIIKELFTEDVDKRLMEQTAGSFFADMGNIVTKYFLLESTKIMDPERSCGRENFTVENLLAAIDWPSHVLDELNNLKPAIDEFGKHIKPARNRILAHYDKSTFLANEVLGAFPRGCEDSFMSALEKMCDVMHQAACDGSCGEIAVSQPGDVLDFKKTLKRAIAFERVFKESTCKDKQKLYSYLQEI